MKKLKLLIVIALAAALCWGCSMPAANPAAADTSGAPAYGYVKFKLNLPQPVTDKPVRLMMVKSLVQGPGPSVVMDMIQRVELIENSDGVYVSGSYPIATGEYYAMAWVELAPDVASFYASGVDSRDYEAPLPGDYVGIHKGTMTSMPMGPTFKVTGIGTQVVEITLEEASANLSGTITTPVSISAGAYEMYLIDKKTGDTAARFIGQYSGTSTSFNWITTPGDFVIYTFVYDFNSESEYLGIYGLDLTPELVYEKGEAILMTAPDVGVPASGININTIPFEGH